MKSASLLTLLPFLLIACTDSGSGPEPEPDAEAIFAALPRHEEARGTYVDSGSSIVVHFSSQVFHSCRSTGEVRTSTLDTLTAQLSRVVDGDTAWVYQDFTKVDDGEGHQYFEGTAMVRLSGGPGLEGEWRVVVEGYHALAGGLPDSIAAQDKAQRPQLQSAYRWQDRRERFSAGAFTVTSKLRAADLFTSGMFPDYVAGKHPARPYPGYSLTIKVLGPLDLELLSTKTGEKVSRTWDLAGAYHIRSTNPARAEYWMDDPDHCTPDSTHWFNAFMDENKLP